jgi:hypothetical protein
VGSFPSEADRESSESAENTSNSAEITRKLAPGLASFRFFQESLNDPKASEKQSP